VLLTNENSFSDGEIFPAGFKALHVGTVMGNPTAGGVIGTVEYPLIDGSQYMRIPKVGWYTIEGKNMENLGIQPDVKVEEDIEHVREGIDDQLNAAVKYLMDEIRKP
jgi:tricorn protease